MKKLISIFLFCFSFSVFGSYFDDSVVISSPRVYSFTGSATNLSYKQIFSDTIDDVFLVYFNNTFGVELNRNNLSHPVPGSTNTFSNSSSFDYQVRVNSTSIYYSPRSFSAVDHLFVAASSLFVSGYRGPGFPYVYVSGNKSYFNVYFPDLVSDIFSSTNTTYRQIIISALSSMTNSLSSIQSLLSHNVQISDSQLSRLDTLLSLIQEGINYSPSYASNVVLLAVNNGYYPSFQGSQLLSSLASASSSSDAQFLANSAVASVRSALSSRGLVAGLQTAPYYDLKNIGDAFNSAAAEQISGNVNGLGGIMGDLHNDSINTFSNWVDRTHDQLQDWKTNATETLRNQWNGIKKMTNQLDDIHATLDNTYGFISDTIGNTIDNGAVNIRPADGSLLVQIANNSAGIQIEGPVELKQSSLTSISDGSAAAAQTVKAAIQDFNHDFLHADDSDFWRYWRDQTISNTLDTVSSIDQLHDTIKDSFSYTNVLNDIYASVSNIVISNSISALLLDDYETFIDNNTFSDIVDNLPDDLADSLSSFGLIDSSDYAGRWWVFQSANMALQSQMALTNAALSSQLLQAISTIDSSFDDGDDSSLLSRWLSLIASLPEPEEILQAVESASNIVSNVGFDRVNVLYDSATNDFNSVVSGVFVDKALPQFLTLTLIPAKDNRPARTFQIPVADHSSLWSLFRQGMAFALSVITLLLFPKYLVWVLTRYTRILEKVIHSLHAYTRF